MTPHHAIRNWHLRILFALPLYVFGTIVLSALAQREAVPDRSEPVDFNWDVRPILSENCFRCHGLDEKNRKANLRLDIAEGAYAPLRRPSAHAVVPGQPDASELIKRITADSAAVRMPPSSTGKVLTPEQVRILTRWIQQGAEYKPHWSFIPPHLSAVPPVNAVSRPVTDIDRFIVAKLQRASMALAPEADKETLINRVALTLTGLPPTLAEVDAFLRDTRPNAYEQLVDRLLASSAYAEHMAEQWLNMARFSESDGFLDDLHDRLVWPYRDWVIKAFNENMAFDRFSTWQIAGDLLPNHTKEQTLATAFLRLGKRTTENGAIDEEYRVEYAVERANLIGVGYLAMTVGCARCHDHKYDPIPTKEFYALTGFFNSVDEPGFYAPGRTGVTPGPTLTWTDARTESTLQNLGAQITATQKLFDAARAAATQHLRTQADELAANHDERAKSLQASIDSATLAHYPFEQTMPVPDDKLPTSRPLNRPAPLPLAPETLAPNQRNSSPLERAAARKSGVATDGRPQGGTPVEQGAAEQTTPIRRNARRAATLPASVVRSELLWTPSVAGGAAPAYVQSPILKPGVKGNAFYFDDINRGILAEGVGQFERTQPFSVDLWIRAAAVYDDSTVFNHLENDYSGGAGYALNLEKNHLRFSMLHSRAGNLIRVRTQQAVQVDTWTHVAVTYDGSSKARGVTIYLDGVAAAVDVLSDTLTRTIYANGGGSVGDEFLGFAFGQRFRTKTMKDGAIDELRLFSKALTPAEVKFIDCQMRGTDAAYTRDELLDALVTEAPEVKTAQIRLKSARDAENELISIQPEIMVMGDTPVPRQTYVLRRGQYDDHGEGVQPQALDAILAWKSDLPRDRRGLAAWLFDPQNPLTARVFVNRIWQMHFGRGLVETSEDFGSQGSIPTHPELLDYLAKSFIDSRWDVKRLQKMVVMSMTYRQRSDVTPEMQQKDPRNTLIERFPRMRMPAELIRDNALVASGLLVQKVGGRSVYPYEPPGIWDGFAAYVYPDRSKVPNDDNHRRALYSFVKRNAPDPALAVFDFPDRGVISVRRATSNTPLQALVLLNDPQFLEAYRAIAREIVRTETTTDGRLVRVFRIATRRPPTADELGVLRPYYDEQVKEFSGDAGKATKLTGPDRAGERPAHAELAALINVVTVVFNSPDAYTLR
jgi:hypothetical protein